LKSSMENTLIENELFALFGCKKKMFYCEVNQFSL